MQERLLLQIESLAPELSHRFPQGVAVLSEQNRGDCVCKVVPRVAGLSNCVVFAEDVPHQPNDLQRR